MIIFFLILLGPLFISTLLLTYLIYRKLLRNREKWVKIIGTIVTFLCSGAFVYFILMYAGYFNQFQR
jgi:hypothetical protein